MSRGGEKKEKNSKKEKIDKKAKLPELQPEKLTYRQLRQLKKRDLLQILLESEEELEFTKQQLQVERELRYAISSGVQIPNKQLAQDIIEMSVTPELNNDIEPETNIKSITEQELEQTQKPYEEVIKEQDKTLEHESIQEKETVQEPDKIQEQENTQASDTVHETVITEDQNVSDQAQEVPESEEELDISAILAAKLNESKKSKRRRK